MFLRIGEIIARNMLNWLKLLIKLLLLHLVGSFDDFSTAEVTQVLENNYEI